MENGGKEKQFFASQTSQVPVSGGKDWQIYATCFAKNNENGCKDQESKARSCIQKNGNGYYRWQGLLTALLNVPFIIPYGTL